MKQQPFKIITSVLSISVFLSLALGIVLLLYASLITPEGAAIWYRSVGKPMVFVPLMIYAIGIIQIIISSYREDRKKFKENLKKALSLNNLKKALPGLKYVAKKVFFDFVSIWSFLLLLFFLFFSISALFQIQYALLKGGEELDIIAPMAIEGLEFYFDNFPTIIIIFLVLCSTFVWSYKNHLKHEMMPQDFSDAFAEKK